MSQPAPTPSRAALNTMRAMLFGTTCSLLLLAEERRRRIQVAQRMVENARRLKQAKRHYRTGKALLSSAAATNVGADIIKKGMEAASDATLEDIYRMTEARGPDQWQKRSKSVPRETRAEGRGPHGHHAGKKQWSTAQTMEPEKAEAEAGHPDLAAQRHPPSRGNAPLKRRRGHRATWSATTRPSPSPVWGWTNPSITRISTQAESDFPSLGPGESQGKNIGDPKKRRGQLRQALDNKATDEEVRQRQTVRAAMDAAQESIKNDLALLNVDGAVKTFQGLTQSYGLSTRAADHFILQLQSAGFQQQALEAFAWTYKQTCLSGPQFWKKCKLITRDFGPVVRDSNQLLLPIHGPSHEDVMRTVLDAAQANKVNMSGRVAALLLDAHHDCYGDYLRLKAVFYANFSDLGMISDPAKLVTCMMSHAAKAGDTGTVELLEEKMERIAMNLNLDGKISLKAKSILSRAMVGDWDAVESGLKEVREMAGGKDLGMYRNDLNAIVEQYMATHTAEELEGFVGTHVLGLGLVLGPGMITAVAEMYARSGNAGAFGSWIRVCIQQQGYGGSQELLSAIFSACKKHWRYSHRSLELLLQRIATPGSGQRPSGASSGMSAGLGAWSGSRLLSQRRVLPQGTLVNMTHSSVSGNSVPRTREAWEARIRKLLREKAVAQEWESLLNMYSQAIEQGMIPTDGCVNMAAMAAIRCEGLSSPRAWAIAVEARKLGSSLHHAMRNILMARLQYIQDRYHDFPDDSMESKLLSIAEGVRLLVQRTLDNELPMDAAALNRATRICLRVRAYDVATRLCKLSAILQARAAGDDATPAAEVDVLSSKYNFSNLVFALSAGREYHRLGTLLSVATQDSSYAWITDNVAMQALERARRRLRACFESAMSPPLVAMHREAFEVASEGLGRIKALRREYHAARNKKLIDDTILNALQVYDPSHQAASMSGIRSLKPLIEGVDGGAVGVHWRLAR